MEIEARGGRRVPRLVKGRTGAVLVTLAALAAAGGCRGTNPCKKGTVLVTVTFGGMTGAADKIDVEVRVGVSPLASKTLDHRSDMSSGSIEVDFPKGYHPGEL